MRYVIGLTGGIACGKSTVSGILAALGASVLDADRIGHEVLKKGQAAYGDVVGAFGRQILDEAGEVDRKILGPIVFSDPQKLKRLNSLTHPHIINNIVKQISTKDGIMILDAALLYEAGLDKLCDEVWIVQAEKEQQIARIRKRDGIGPEEALRRIESQDSRLKEAQGAAYVLDNSGSLAELEREVKRLYHRVEHICGEKRRKSSS